MYGRAFAFTRRRRPGLVRDCARGAGTLTRGIYPYTALADDLRCNCSLGVMGSWLSPISVKVVGTWFDSGAFFSAARGGVDEERRESGEGKPLWAGE